MIFPGMKVPADLVYMRFYRGKAIIRVARVRGGMCAALYPTSDKEVFETEACREIDDPSNKGSIRRSEVGDDIWLRLLDNEPTDQILKEYKNIYDNCYVALPADDDSLDHIDLPTFRIAEDVQEPGC